MLNDVEQGTDIVIQEGNVVRLNLPYISYTSELFYHGDKGDVEVWRLLDRTGIKKPGEEMIAALEQAGDVMSEYLSRLDYEPAEYEYNDKIIEINAEPGFVLVKDSYFPYWGTEQGDVLSTSQGFMLVYTNESTAILNYENPL